MRIVRRSRRLLLGGRAFAVFLARRSSDLRKFGTVIPALWLRSSKSRRATQIYRSSMRDILPSAIPHVASPFFISFHFIVLCSTAEFTKNTLWTHSQLLVKGPMEKDIHIAGSQFSQLETSIHKKLQETCKTFKSHSKHWLEYELPQELQLCNL